MTPIAQLTAARLARGLDIQEVAAAANVHPNTIKTAEKRGRSSTETLTAWASALGFAVALVPKDADFLVAEERK